MRSSFGSPRHGAYAPLAGRHWHTPNNGFQVWNQGNDGSKLQVSPVFDPAKTEDALEWLWSDPTSPALLQVMVDTYTNAYPKIAFGKPMTKMEPFFQPIEMEST